MIENSYYADPQAILDDVAVMLRPPRRVSVSENAEQVVRIESPGGYAGPWDASLTPYMVEPMDTLKSRRHEAVVMVSPARTGKTEALLDCWLAHSVVADPGDIGMYFSTQALAHDYRKRRVERMHRNSPKISEMISTRSHDTTIEMVIYRTGMILNLGWPSSGQLAQRDLRYVALSDYDSFPDDVGGEGSPFDLAKKRIQVAMSAGMALVESSPKRPELPTETQSRMDLPHAAPHVNGGILPLYNRGDRRRWHWTCYDGCGETFEAPALPDFDPHENIAAAASTVRVHCPHCGLVYDPSSKRRLNASASWLAAPGTKSKIASFWLLGCAAAFQTWESIVSNYLIAKKHLEDTGDETALAATTNTDQGMPYRPQKMRAARDSTYLQIRKEVEMVRCYISPGIRVLYASVDVQADRFEVAVWGYGVRRERWLVDRYAIRRTADDEHVQPASYVEHWDILVSKVINATYKIDDDRELRIRRVVVDSGGYGERGGDVQVTGRAYEWWRSLKKQRLSQRVFLIKGESRKTGSVIKLSYLGGGKKKRGSDGDIPVLLIRVDALKDTAYNDLQRDVPGPGYVHIPEWIPNQILDELVAERKEAGGWKNVYKRNETWDLLVYADAIWSYAGGDRINWERPPSWVSDDWAANPEVLENDQLSRSLPPPKPRRRQPARDQSFAPEGWGL